MINNKIQVLLSGITDKVIRTLGAIKIPINNIYCDFHVVPEDFAIPFDGIIGVKLLTEQKLRLDKGFLEINNKKFIINSDNALNKERINNIHEITNNNELTEISILEDTESILELIIKENNKLTQNLIDDSLNSKIQNELIENKNENISKLISNINISIKDNENNDLDEFEIYNYSTFLLKLEESTDFEIDEKEEKYIINFDPGGQTNLELQLINEKESNFIYAVETENGTELENANVKRLDKVLQQINLKHLNKNEIEIITNLIQQNEDIFWLEGEKFGNCDIEYHEIHLTDNRPIYVKQFPLPHKLKEIAIKEAQKLIDNDLVRPSKSAYNAPAWIVKKKPGNDGKEKWRLVIDYRKLNEKTIPDPYLIPSITEIFDEIGNNKYYTSIDMASGFHQIKMKESDIHKTAFSIHPLGRFEFKVLPFGLINSPRIFQRIINNVLSNLIGKICFVYIDDIIIFANTIEEHTLRFKLVIQRLREAGLKLASNKCEFLKKEITFLGHILNENGIKADPKKVEAVKKFPIPKNVKNIKEFLGLAGYYRRFINNFANISKPLTTLLKKDTKFIWNNDTQKAFDKLKDTLCAAPLLQFPQLNKPYIITTDASGYAIGAILSQGIIGQDKPIAYASRVLKGAELKYHTYEKEALAIMFGIKTFKNYIYGNKFTIVTDHKPLLSFKSADKNTRVQKWRLQLSGYEYDIIYKKGKMNVNADALSRNPIQNNICVITRAQKKRENDNNNNNNNNSNIKNDTNISENNVKFPNKTQSKYIGDKGRPRKTTDNNRKNNTLDNIETNSTNNQNDGNSDEKRKFKNIININDSIEFRNDNIIHIVTEKGKSLDNHTDSLIAKKCDMTNIKFIKNEIKVIDIEKKKCFILCLNTAESNKTIKESLTSLFTKLNILLAENKINKLSISKDINIISLNWLEIEEILINIFQNTEIKILVCLNNVEFVKPSDRDRIFDLYHASTIGGHSGINRTYNRIKEKYIWENLKKDIENRIQKCDTCQRNKLKRVRTKQPMIITDTPFKTFDKIAMDIIGPLNITKNGNKFILTIQDQLSKFLIAVPLQDQTAETVADAFIKRFICIFSSPKVVLTDRGTNFTSKLIKAIARRFKFSKIETTSFSPQSNGSLERAHHPLCEYLKNFTSKKIEWDELLELAQFNYNTSVHSSHKFTPHELVFAFPPRLPSSEPLRKYEQIPTFNKYLENLVTNMEEIATLARENLISAKETSKKYYDRFINPTVFKIGDEVWMLKEPKPGKLEKDHYMGPFEILKNEGNSNIVINYKGKPKTVHANKLKICKKN